MKPLSIFSAQKSMSSQILCCALERSINIRNPTKLGRKGLKGSRPTKATETMTVSMESRLNSSGTSSQDPQPLQLCGKVNDLLSDLGDAPETFIGRILFMSMFNDISLVTEKAIKKNIWQRPESSKYLQRKLVLDNGHLLVQVLKRSGILVKRIVHKELGIISRTNCCWNSQKADILLSVQRLHCPGVFSKAKDMENCQYTSLQIIQYLFCQSAQF